MRRLIMPPYAHQASESLKVEGVLKVVLDYFGLSYIPDTYITWPVHGEGTVMLILQWEEGPRLLQYKIAIDWLALHSRQEDVIYSWLP